MPKSQKHRGEDQIDPNLWRIEKLALFDRKLEEFSRVICGDVVTTQIPEFHKELYSLLPTEGRLMLVAPRGFAKSVIGSKIYPLWCALMKRKRDICIISASEGLAVEHIRYIKNAIDGNDDVLKFFGKLKSSKWSETHIIVEHGGNAKVEPFRVNVRAKGAGGQIRGFRPDLVILDDIETDESVASEEQRRKLKEWLFKACLNTLVPDGQLVILGTIISPLCVLEDLYEDDNGWTKRKLQAYKGGVEEKGCELWPQVWDHERLQGRKREIGSWAFASEYMNSPISNELAPIKQDQIRYWTEVPEQISLVISVDPAYSEDVKADYKVASLIGIDPQFNRYLISYIRTHKPTGEFIDGIINLFLRYKSKITAVGVPSGGVEKQFYKSVLNKCEERKVYPPVKELKNTFVGAGQTVKRNKLARIVAALQPLFEQGKYYISREHVAARDELLTLSSAMRWDDLVDSMAYAEQILTPFYQEPQENKVDRYGTKITRTAVAHDYGY